MKLSALLVVAIATVVLDNTVEVVVAGGEDETSGFPFQSLSQDYLEELWKEAESLWEEKKLENFRNGTGHSRARRSTKSTPESDVFAEKSNVFEYYAEILNHRHNISKRQTAGSSTPAQCTNPAFNCQTWANSKFRTQDGTCNNLNNPVWGAANRPFNRYLSPAYNDGFNEPRGRFQSVLPNPRRISVVVHPDSSNVNTRITNMVPQFGQFLDHDITLTPEAGSQCCSNPSSNPANCWPISVQGDPFFSSFSQTCMDFTRSTPCIRNGIREQMNANTAYIDGSQIYGSNVQRQNSLRTFSGGMLRTNPNLQGFLPVGSSIGIQAQGTFAAGDDRINEMPGLAVMHNVWLMEHNRIASTFRQIRPSWNDERIFQETRRIIIALLQQVTYNEYLPLILGPAAMTKNNLPVGTWSVYDNRVDATIANSFATASYRFGHSLISGLVRLISSNNAQVGSYLVKDEYFQSRQMTQLNGQGYDLILRGLMTQNAPEMDHFVTTGVTNFLFKPQNQNFGSDLVARNIQRGRDHGLPSYNEYRANICGFSPLPSTFTSTAPAGINPDAWAKASQVYRSPLDIDLFVGGLMETPVSGGLSGQTFTCLKAEQFRTLKFGDRYFFTHDLSTGFTPDQLTDLTKQRLGDIICRNSQQPDTPQNVFLVPSSSNPSISCNSRPTLNLNLYN